MTSITLSDVSVDFPVYSSRSRGLLNTLLGFGDRSSSRIHVDASGGVQVTALKKISLELKAGDRVGLIGRNGAGKTTLLRVLSGAYEPTEGSISIEGSISALTDLMLGMDPDGNGYDFIKTRSTFLGLSRRGYSRIVEDVEVFTELGDHLHLPVHTYSSGMLLRLAFAVASSVKPDILLMDEMIGVGDSRFIEKANQRLQVLMDSVKILVIASHNNEIIRKFCNRVIWLESGEIRSQGAVDQTIYEYGKF